MVKLRLEGTAADVQATLTYLRGVFDVLEESQVYPNRPPSQFVRVYIDIEASEDPFGGHVGQWLDVDGEEVHMLADPNMSEETAEALREVVRAAKAYIGGKTIFVRELCQQSAGQDIEVEGWQINVLGESFTVISIHSPQTDQGDYQVFYRSSGRHSQKTIFVQAEEVLKRE